MFLGGEMSDSAMTAVAMRVAKVVEDARRRTILRGIVDTDREAQGWARVATGRETCGWCTNNDQSPGQRAGEPAADSPTCTTTAIAASVPVPGIGRKTTMVSAI